MIAWYIESAEAMKWYEEKRFLHANPLNISFIPTFDRMFKGRMKNCKVSLRLTH